MSPDQGRSREKPPQIGELSLGLNRSPRPEDQNVTDIGLHLLSGQEQEVGSDPGLGPEGVQLFFAPEVVVIGQNHPLEVSPDRAQYQIHRIGRTAGGMAETVEMNIDQHLLFVLSQINPNRYRDRYRVRRIVSSIAIVIKLPVQNPI
jgi:hypothetical protein